MNDAFPIRPARTTDLPILGQLGKRLVETHHAFDEARFMRPDGDIADGYAWFLGTQLEEPDVCIFVATDGEDVIGYVYAGLEPLSWKELREAAGFIHDVVVDPRFEGRGVAGHLIEAAAAWLESKGAPRVLLWTAAANARAQRLFAKLGFRSTMIEMTRERA